MEKFLIFDGIMVLFNGVSCAHLINVTMQRIVELIVFWLEIHLVLTRSISGS